MPAGRPSNVVKEARWARALAFLIDPATVPETELSLAARKLRTRRPRIMKTKDASTSIVKTPRKLKSKAKPRLIRYAGFDPSERNHTIKRPS